MNKLPHRPETALISRGFFLRLLCVSILLASVFPVGADEWESRYDRLFDSITVRKSGGQTHGRDAVYPLLWFNSRYLINGDRYHELVKALEEFAALSDEQVGSIPAIRRAILQRHLWAVFDWLAGLSANTGSPFDLERQQILQPIVAALIKRVALSEEQIQRLPNTFAATAAADRYPGSPDADRPLETFFPSDLYDTDGAWVLLTKIDHPLTAKMHTQEVKSRSAFHVFMRLPTDREATLGYLDKLSKFEKLWVTEKPAIDARTTPNGGINSAGIFVNPETPQFPVGTQVALVDQALLIDNEGEIVASPLLNSIQVRAYLRMELRYEKGKSNQAFAEFVMQPLKLMEVGDSTMRAIGPDEVRFSTIFTGDHLHGKHPIPRPPRLHSCNTCHSAWGIHSVNSRAEFFQSPRSLIVPRFEEGQLNDPARATIQDKEKGYSWGLLKGLWRKVGS